MSRRFYIKEVFGCRSCPYFCDEGEFCHHPIWGKKIHVVNMYDRNNNFIDNFTFPDDCPLVSTGDLPVPYEITVDNEIKEELENILSKFYQVN